MWAQELWFMGLVASWHVGASWARDQTCVPCIYHPLHWKVDYLALSHQGSLSCFTLDASLQIQVATYAAD